jgi:hypothetical protein
MNHPTNGAAARGIGSGIFRKLPAPLGGGKGIMRKD